eukprot:Protomagalhaensia_wolfi_Nauph_80__622@NODE_1354_length_1568_cov_915_319817_g1046_i0_p2_GENE_NODE_1354_length_1568_cov_915_319817_g1046_i0NODE_1354_length_1568_cov_915_319817_g1046_i0_p2_ORF_typecomplete_len188_score12_48_NODE_1354_length_1568_cov_915_319817_g1046_i08021365
MMLLLLPSRSSNQMNKVVVLCVIELFLYKFLDSGGGMQMWKYFLFIMQLAFGSPLDVLASLLSTMGPDDSVNTTSKIVFQELMDRTSVCICQRSIATKIEISELDICSTELCQRCMDSPQIFGCTRTQIESFGGLELCIVDTVPFCYLKVPSSASTLITYAEEIAECVWNVSSSANAKNSSVGAVVF